MDPARDPKLVAVLEPAARLQELVPGAVLVGGTAAILYAGHRESDGHDHVLADLAEVARLVAAPGLARAEFARRVGTSASRLSTYVNGRVTPSAALMVRMRRVACAESESPI